MKPVRPSTVGSTLAVWVLVSCVRAAPPPPVERAVEPPPAPPPPTSEAPVEPEPTPSVEDRVAQVLGRLSLEQKVGQLMMVGFSGTEVTPDIAELVRGRQVGGVCLFKRNIISPAQVGRLNDQVRALLEDAVPPFIAVDQEGGNVVRIAERSSEGPGPIVLPGNMALAATRQTRLAYEAGRAQAEDLKLLGFTMNLAPVLDVNVNPRNPVIGIRSFSDRPELVAELGADFVRGQQDANLVTVAKHFPGHGNTDADSHKRLPLMTESEDELMRQVGPFRAAVERGLDGVMTAHVAVPKVTGDDLPATLSPRLLTGLLRGRLGFDGLVLTDELEMEAIASRYGVGRAAVRAVAAGADMVLVPWRPEKKREVYEALLAAARSGELPSAQLDASVRRIVKLKLKRGVFDKPAPLAERLERLGSHRSLAEEISRLAVTLLRTDGESFPLPARRKVGVITAEATLAHAIRARLPNARVLVVPAYPSQAQRPGLRDKARELALASDLVVVGLINSQQLDLYAMAVATGRPVVAVTMGVPYLAEHVDEARAVLAVYSYRESASEAAAAALFGEQGTPGRLPVSLQRWGFGHGLDPVGEQKTPSPGASMGGRAGAR